MEVFLADLIEAQRKQGLYAIGLVHGQPGPDDPSWVHRVPVQAQILYAPLGLGFPFQLRRLIRQFEPDVLHLHMPNNAVFWALFMPAARAIPWVIHWQSDVVRSRIKRAISLAYQFFYEPFERAVLRQAARVIVSSPNYLEASTALRAWREKTDIIPLGMWQGSRPATDPTCTPTASWSRGKFRLLSLGRLTYYKGFETLIEAVCGLPEVELLIAGAGEMAAELAQLIDRLTPAGQAPTVRLLGAVTETQKHALLSTCDAFCLASRERTESFGLAVVEAMQHGKPCIVSNLQGSGLPWLVTHSGGGLLAEVEDPASWRSAIERLRLKPSLRSQLGQAGHQAALGVFSIASCADRIAALYASLAPEVFFKAPVHERLNLIFASTEEGIAQARLILQGLRQTGRQSFLLVNGSGHPCALDDLIDGDDVTIMTPALKLSDWNSMQAGIRFALRHGYRQALVINLHEKLTPGAVHALIDAKMRLPHVDLLIGSPDLATRPPALTRLIDKSVRYFSGVSLTHVESCLRLYEHDAMVIASSREATLLDHDDAGALLLLQKARLRIAAVPVGPSASAGAPRAPWRTIGHLAALVVFKLSLWPTKRHVKSTAPVEDASAGR